MDTKMRAELVQQQDGVAKGERGADGARPTRS